MVCFAYDEHMRNVLSILRSQTLNIFEHAEHASVYNNVHRRMPAYGGRTRRMSSVPLMYTCVCERIRWHTRMPYAVV